MSDRYPGGFITKDTPVTTPTSATGVWTLDQAMQATKAGNWPTNGPFFIEDMFSTWLYTGNGSTQTITNGIDLLGKGGLIWIKSRNNSTFANSPNVLTDSVTGFSKYLISSQTGAQLSWSTDAPVPTSTGFNLPVNGAVPYTNYLTGSTYASWTFREQPKFFDVVTYTGNGATTRTINHNLASVPGCIIIKATSTTGDWWVTHRNNGTDAVYGSLNLTDAMNPYGDPMTRFATSTEFYPRLMDSSLNANGVTFVAYLFAHNAGGFGLSGSDNVISCGSYTGTGSPATVDLGYEPQWIMTRNVTDADDWFMFDNMRGIATGGTDAFLRANLSNAENTATDVIDLTATGFKTVAASRHTNGKTYIYIAIRRGLMKTPTTGTSVFAPLATNNASGTTNTTNFPVDLQINAERGGVHNTFVVDRLRGVVTTPTDATSPYLATNATTGENPETITRYWNNTGFQTSLFQAGAGTAWWNFRRAPGFFDEVCYTGDGGSTVTRNHNLGVQPELIIVKSRGSAQNWAVAYRTSGTTYLYGLELNTTSVSSATTFNYGSSMSATTFDSFVGSNINQSETNGVAYVAYLFATCPGVSKVGSYTGTGTTQTINCGFTGGARFVLIKRTDSTGDWYVWDTARGMIPANDPYLLLNGTAAEVTGTDYIDTAATGFEITSTAPAAINASGGTFIFLAIS
jgi:hypothetical protein